MTTLEVPWSVYAAVRALMSKADQDHAIREGTDGEVIDLNGIAFRSRSGVSTSDISISTLLSSRTQQGLVEFSLNGELVQMDLDKAREVVTMLMQAIEAAMTDQMVYAFLTQTVGLRLDQAQAALLDFRAMRQGSRERVHPS